MLAAWRRTSVKLTVPERMGHTMSEAAVSITITSLTDMISFWMGIFSPFPSVRIFCTYSALAVAFTYIWHITFFAGCMSVFGYFEHRNLHGIFGFEVKPVSVAIKGKKSNLRIYTHALVLYTHAIWNVHYQHMWEATHWFSWSIRNSKFSSLQKNSTLGSF